MNFDEFAERPRRIDCEIQRTLHKSEMLTARLEGASRVFDRVAVQSSRKNKVEEYLILLADYQNEIKQLMVEYDKAVDMVSAWLYANLRTNHAEVLERKYCFGESAMEIADAMCLEYEAVRQRIRRATARAREKYAKGVKEQT